MNSDNITQVLQQGFRVTLGATASLIETLQDPQRRTENFSQIKFEIDQLTTDWALKGEMTEQEARRLVDTLLRQWSHQQSSSTAETTSTTVTTPSTVTAPPAVQLELQELTAQLAAIRAELEKMRNSGDAS